MSVSQLSEQLAKAGINSHVFTTTANGAEELSVEAGAVVNVEGVSVTYFSRLTKDHSHFSPSLLLALWKTALQYDVIHIHAWWNATSILSCLVAFLRRRPYIISPRGTLSAYSFLNRKKMIKRLIFKCSAPLLSRGCLHATADAERDALITLLSPLKIFTIPNFVRLSVNQSPVKQLPGEYLKLLFFGRIEEKKGLDILFKALKNLSSSYMLTIAGSGDPAYIAMLKTMADEFGIQRNISWAGFQFEHKFEIMAKHDLLILPSHDENFGNVVIESLSVGTPVLLTPNVGLSDYIARHCFGWIANLDEDSLATQLREISPTDPVFIHTHRSAAAQIKYDFSEAHLRNAYMDMYRELTGKISL